MRTLFPSHVTLEFANRTNQKCIQIRVIFSPRALHLNKVCMLVSAIPVVVEDVAHCFYLFCRLVNVAHFETRVSAKLRK